MVPRRQWGAAMHLAADAALSAHWGRPVCSRSVCLLVALPAVRVLFLSANHLFLAAKARSAMSDVVQRLLKLGTERHDLVALLTVSCLPWRFANRARFLTVSTSVIFVTPVGSARCTAVGCDAGLVNCLGRVLRWRGWGWRLGGGWGRGGG